MLNVRLSDSCPYEIVAGNTETLPCNIVPALKDNYMHVLTILALRDVVFHVLTILALRDLVFHVLTILALRGVILQVLNALQFFIQIRVRMKLSSATQDSSEARLYPMPSTIVPLVWCSTSNESHAAALALFC